jgi:hypothetical protein
MYNPSLIGRQIHENCLQHFWNISWKFDMHRQSSFKIRIVVELEIRPQTTTNSVLRELTFLSNGYGPVMELLFVSQMNVTAWFKQRTSNNFRQFIKIDKIDYCPTYSKMRSIPWMEEIVIYGNSTFPQFIHDCPYQGVIGSIFFPPLCCFYHIHRL